MQGTLYTSELEMEWHGLCAHPTMDYHMGVTCVGSVGRNSLYRLHWQFLGHFPYFWLALTHPHYPTIFLSHFPHFPYFPCWNVLSQKLLKMFPQSMYAYTGFWTWNVKNVKHWQLPVPQKPDSSRTVYANPINMHIDRKLQTRRIHLQHWNRGFW